MQLFRMLTFATVICSLIIAQHKDKPKQPKMPERQYTIEKIQMGDVGPVRIVQLYADGFEKLTLKEKVLTYYLAQAAIAARDIAIDQRHRYALEVRDLIEAVYTHPKGIDKKVYENIVLYTKFFWVNNSMYDNITARKFVMPCTFDQFKMALQTAIKNGAKISLSAGETLDQKLERLLPSMFDPAFEPTQTNKTPGQDMIAGSANNLYVGTNFAEVDAWAKAGNEKNDLNSKVVKENGQLVEKVYRAGNKHLGGTVEPGLYATDLHVAISYLEKAKEYASNPLQAENISKLIKYYQTGDLKDWREYNIGWVKETESQVDMIHGFVEVYLDARGAKGQFESVINFANPELTELFQKVGTNAQYFEDRMPWADQYKKKDVKPLKYTVINVVVETGDAGPVSAIGINLPNEQDVREQYGSKSVTLYNIVDAYEKTGGKDILKEFAFDKNEVASQDKYGSLADNMHTALHEVLGHASGKVSPNLKVDPQAALPGYYSTLEEARADLVALYHIWDPKLVEIGIIPNTMEVVKAMYDKEVRNACLVQLQRVPKGHDQLEEDHMKNRQMIAHWLLKNADCIERIENNGKSYFRITSYEKMRNGVGKLLAEIQRIKSEGDFAAAKTLIDTYGLKIDTALRDQVLVRMEKLDRAVYTGFVMPKLEPVKNKNGEISDVKISYPLDLGKQMLEYSSFTKKEKERAAAELSK
ncbi:MAG: peptidase M49 [Ignavibacteriales bacterium]|nr:peptidase M49 [Ignavibacteriales bacterium]